MEEIIAEARQSVGFMNADEIVRLIKRGNTILDPHSTLISTGVTIGTGNVFYPNTIIQVGKGCKVVIGNSNTFYPGTFMVATQGGITIGDHNTFGVGGAYIQANYPGATITVGNNGRFMNGAALMGETAIGDGCQLLGAITAQSCTLQGGGDFTEPDPDKRGAVLKGMGLARNVSLDTGQVINGWGDFAASRIEWQRDYHKQGK